MAGSGFWLHVAVQILATRSLPCSSLFYLVAELFKQINFTVSMGSDYPSVLIQLLRFWFHQLYMQDPTSYPKGGTTMQIMAPLECNHDCQDRFLRRRRIRKESSPIYDTSYRNRVY